MRGMKRYISNDVAVTDRIGDAVFDGPFSLRCGVCGEAVPVPGGGLYNHYIARDEDGRARWYDFRNDVVTHLCAESYTKAAAVARDLARLPR